MENIWISGSGVHYTYSDLCKIVKRSSMNGAKVFIGSDSFASSKGITFATAICLHGNGQKSRYFFLRNQEPKNKYPALAARILEEVKRSVEIADKLVDSGYIKVSNIELHLDVSPTHTNNGTSKYALMLRGYVSGAGYNCKLKPNAWASQTVADKHSK